MYTEEDVKDENIVNEENMVKDDNGYNDNYGNNKSKGIFKVCLIFLLVVAIVFLIVYFFVIKNNNSNSGGLLSVDANYKVINVGDKFEIQASVSGDNKPKISYESNNSNCLVASNIVTGAMKGECIIAVKYKNQEKHVKVMVNESNVINQIAMLSSSNVDLKVNGTYQIKLKVIPESMANNVNYSSDNNSCSVSSTGVITALKEGNCLIRIFASGYSESLYVSVNITKNIPISVKKTGKVNVNRCAYNTIEEALNNKCNDIPTLSNPITIEFIPDDNNALYRGDVASITLNNDKLDRVNWNSTYFYNAFYNDYEPYSSETLNYFISNNTALSKGKSSDKIIGKPFSTTVLYVCMTFVSDDKTSFYSPNVCKFVYLDGEFEN